MRTCARERIVQTWTTLNRWIDTKGFPPGRIIGRHRAWTEAEVFAWIEAQPADKAPPKGAIAQPEKVAERVAKAMATKAAKRDQAAA